MKILEKKLRSFLLNVVDKYSLNIQVDTVNILIDPICIELKWRLLKCRLHSYLLQIFGII